MKKLLIVDDMPEGRGMLAMLFQDEFEVHEASGGKRALELLQGEPFDLVISDIDMPEGDGRWLLQEMRNLKPRPPVFIVSGDMNATEKEILSLGASAFFMKPYSIEKLLELAGTV